MKKHKSKIKEADKQTQQADNFVSNPSGDENMAVNESLPEHDLIDNKIVDTNEDIEGLKKDYEAQIMEWKEKYIRLSADFDNYRKRTLKEKIEITKYANEEVLKGILPIVDDFERGIKNLELSNDIDAIKTGIILIYNKFKDFLSQNGVKEIEITNSKDFNTDYHEAITRIPVEDKVMSGKIVDVIQKGYLLNDKVIRYSKVVVGE